ncbi:RagB/SusD family nutrient uptake outer membrane protein [Aestuariibaculum suncheonense]|uniref:RagB/SusD family nutrient uptake outer membrane protein n=1 Tax=Aestuariibaculum suncheonense TaxID=1028745 RepID=A0A8J6QFZ2_9FLAO|nr:RagB/SusD family nutrient uptake outer membrane protein [Aestuariibaculum suncheonense]MBD0835437.1 RagB/SusD family nutrient uptake outer membrane protein [Aestuariibaculum suncheonense]
MKKIFLYIIAISNFLVSCSVNDWLTVQPEDTLSKDEMFESKQGFYDALFGVYTLTRDNYDHNGRLMSEFIEHLAAQWEVTSGTINESIKFHEYSLLDGQISSTFGAQYKPIANLNLMLEYLETQDFLSDEDYKLIKAECLGLRAWLHFDLIRLWGPIPSKVNTTKKYLPYVTVLGYERNLAIGYNEYMQLLQSDINEAEQIFNNYPTHKTFRLGKWGVLALQSRINLWLGNKEAALGYANTILDFVKTDSDETFKLGALDNIGIEDYRFNREHLFGIHVDFETTLFNNQLYNNTAYLNELYEYSGSDIRLELWEDRKVTGLAEPAKNPLKYTGQEGSVPIIRLSEIYLIAMECGDLTKANELYEEFAESRGIGFVEITSISQLNEILLKEYRKEFIGEGVLFYYYKRNDVSRIPRNPEVCNDDCYVLPLPRKEIDVNG